MFSEVVGCSGLARADGVNPFPVGGSLGQV